MATDLKQYWRHVRKMAAEFDPEAYERDLREEDPNERDHLKRSTKEVWVKSLDMPAVGSVAGMTLTMRPYPAAEAIFQGTYRLAKDEEIARERERRGDAKKEIEATEQARKQTINTTSSVTIDANAFAEAFAAAAARPPAAQNEPGEGPSEPSAPARGRRAQG